MSILSPFDTSRDSACNSAGVSSTADLSLPLGKRGCGAFMSKTLRFLAVSNTSCSDE